MKGSGFNTLISGYRRVARVASGDRQMHRCLTKAALSQPSWTYFNMWIAVWPYEVAPAEWQSCITDLRVLEMQFFSLSLLSMSTSDNTYCSFSLLPFSYFGSILDTHLPSSHLPFIRISAFFLSEIPEEEDHIGLISHNQYRVCILARVSCHLI